MRLLTPLRNRSWIGGIAIVLVSCSDSSPLSPVESAAVAGPSRSLHAQSTSAYETDDLLFEIQISPTVSHPGLGPLPLGNVAHPTLVEFEVSGMLERYHSDAMTWYHSDPALDLRGDYKGPFDAGGFFNFHTYCSGFVHAIFRKPNGFSGGGVNFCDRVEPAFKVI